MGDDVTDVQLAGRMVEFRSDNDIKVEQSWVQILALFWRVERPCPLAL